MKILLLNLMIALQGCAVGIGSAPVTGYKFLTEPPNGTPQFRTDHQACMAEVETMWPNAGLENMTLIQYRRCLVNKGYRLLS
jgi:hypothetical protein